MIDKDHKAFIQTRINEAQAKRSMRFRDQEFYNDALINGVCPLCGGKLLPGSELMELFTCTKRYTCIECGAKHKRYYGD